MGLALKVVKVAMWVWAIGMPKMLNGGWWRCNDLDCGHRERVGEVLRNWKKWHEVGGPVVVPSCSVCGRGVMLEPWLPGKSRCDGVMEVW